jgi:uncharacterized SAM-binding protein YcdF (DUF218 family)
MGTPAGVNQKRGCRFALALLFLTPACAAAGYLLLYLAGSFLVVSDRLEKADTAVVLSGGDIGRVTEAARLVNEGLARYLILTDTDEVTTSGRRATDYLYSEATKLGIAVPQIAITGYTVTSTTGEAAAVRQLMTDRGWISCIVVTDPFHSRRTRLIFRTAFQGSSLEVRVKATPDHWYRPGSWFFSQRGWAATISEYIRLIGYWSGVR